MKPIRFIPDGTKIPFMGSRIWSFPLSSLLIVASLALYFTFNLNFGIDFKGGTLIEIKTAEEVADLGSIRSSLNALDLGDVEVQEFGAPNDVLIRVQTQDATEEHSHEEAQQNVVDLVKETLGDSIEYRRVEVVGPRVSGELASAGTISVLSALFAVLVYIWFRFEWQFALGAVIATVHDVILTIGVFAFLQMEFNLTTIAALLTIVGYSLNDTVVVYDRIRENLRKYKKKPLTEILDLSINQTLSRTILTSGTTLLALGSLYFLGGEVIRSFTFAMIWGIFVGTYSSIFIAAPLLIFLNLRADQLEVKEDTDEAGNVTAS
ncbi:protein translocase subunit SecF [uncultured Cohaesibacter sp.]|uniref:protein translocase subunit SecF n=1 Tax=uncultured Cohaesibacter sp. TaxID=1002546 RepID=UPI0029C60D9B|nr:protein translocase subunit SecF [uncultured Cohaesibacter sp.]